MIPAHREATYANPEPYLMSDREEREESERLFDLETSKLGAEVSRLLNQAAEILKVSDRRWADAVVNLRQRQFAMTDEERLAAKLIDLLGSEEDCFVVREIVSGVSARTGRAA